MSFEIEERKKRINKFLKWLDAKDDFIPKEMAETYLFDNYAYSEDTIKKLILQLFKYGYLRFKGQYLTIGRKKELL